MKWFIEVFLPSLEARMTNPKYPNRVILSEKQERICEKYMKSTQHRDCSYNTFFTNYFIVVGNKRFLMYFAGKYTFLMREIIPERVEVEYDDGEEV